MKNQSQMEVRFRLRFGIGFRFIFDQNTTTSKYKNIKFLLFFTRESCSRLLTCDVHCRSHLRYEFNPFGPPKSAKIECQITKKTQSIFISILGSILGRYGLHFETFFGSIWAPLDSKNEGRSLSYSVLVAHCMFFGLGGSKSGLPGSENGTSQAYCGPILDKLCVMLGMLLG